MKLDSRIKRGKRILCCFDMEKAKEFVGKECYFTDNIEDFYDLDIFEDSHGFSCKGNLVLSKKYDDEEQPFQCLDNHILLKYCFCLPCEWVKRG